MSQVITAFYDSRSEAESVQNQLRSLGIIKDQNDTSGSDTSGDYRGSVYDRSSSGYTEGDYSSSDRRGFWSDSWRDENDYAIPDEDRHTYEEGVHRGGALLTVTVDDQMADRAREIIDSSNAVDIDSRSSEWRSSGWAGSTAGTGAAAGTAAAGSRYYDRDRSFESSRYRTYRRGEGNGPGETSYKASGMGNEAMGNIKQGVGSMTGNESLRQSGQAQERRGEQQRAEGDRRGDQGNEF